MNKAALNFLQQYVGSLHKSDKSTFLFNPFLLREYIDKVFEHNIQVVFVSYELEKDKMKSYYFPMMLMLIHKC